MLVPRKPRVGSLEDFQAKDSDESTMHVGDSISIDKGEETARYSPDEDIESIKVKSASITIGGEVRDLTPAELEVFNETVNESLQGSSARRRFAEEAFVAETFLEGLPIEERSKLKNLLSQFSPDELKVLSTWRTLSNKPEEPNPRQKQIKQFAADSAELLEQIKAELSV